MLKQVIMFLAFLGLAIIVCVQSEDLHLSFYVLFPTLLFAVFYFYDHRKRGWLFIGSAVITSGLYLFYAIRLRSAELIFFTVCLAVFYFFFLAYRKKWKRSLSNALEQRDAAAADLDMLKARHQTRLDSLHHLEKQVAGLLDLFEIARDFGESLSMESIANLLFQKVLPELPFKQMRVLQEEKSKSGKKVTKLTFVITQEGVEKQELISERDEKLLEQLKTENSGDRDAAEPWIFPLLMDKTVSSCAIVEGANSEDLAKFEVLAAYLALQVKKVRLYETVRELSIRDELTGVFVRRHFLERFEEELRRSVKYELPLAVLMLDIDHFKRYNDEYGHLAGDAVLKQVTRLLVASLRKVDVVARYGGEEFVVVLPESQEEGAHEVAERIRSNIARNHFRVFDEETRVTVSIGISLFNKEASEQLQSKDYSDLAFDMIQNADKALYRAKEEGRNRVVLHGRT